MSLKTDIRRLLADATLLSQRLDDAIKAYPGPNVEPPPLISLETFDQLWNQAVRIERNLQRLHDTIPETPLSP